MIELVNLHKTYQSRHNQIDALQNINLQIPAGEIFGIIGPSGAGKSSLIRCINLLERPTQGTVKVDQQNLMSLSEAELRLARRKIGMIFQHFNLLSSRTVYQNISLPLELEGKKTEEIEKIITPLLQLVGLQDKKEVYPSQLSGGQKQRVAIARALVNQPKVLLCDEATSALDPQTTHAILTLLKDINQQFNITILLITHEMTVVKEICDRLAIIQHGCIIEQTEVIKFFGQPETAIAKDFVRKALKEHLPEKIYSRISKENSIDALPLIQISFIGATASEAIISQVIQKFKIDLNILQANIEYIRDQMIGTMIVELNAADNAVQTVIAYLESKGLLVEIIGYVKSNA